MTIGLVIGLLFFLAGVLKKRKALGLRDFTIILLITLLQVFIIAFSLFTMKQPTMN